MQLQDEYKTTITIICQDNTSRILNVIGRWNSAAATSLGKDLEGENFKYARTDFK